MRFEPRYSAIIEAYHDHPPWVVCVGEWLSLVEHLVRDQGVGGSNPLSPTNYFQSFAWRATPASGIRPDA